MELTILDGEHTTVCNSFDGTAISADDLTSATGWQLKSQGLCRRDVCVAVRDRSALTDGDMINIEAFAAALRRPVVVDRQATVVALGESIADLTAQLRDRRAPDFTLNDIDGNSVTMSKIGRKKKVLVAWSSW